MQTSVSPPAGCPNLQRSPLSSAYAGPVYDSRLLVPPTPASPSFVSTPGSSGVSTSASPETRCVDIPAPRKKRPQRSAPYARPSARGQRSISGSSIESTDAVALDNIRKGARQFVRDNPHVIEPCIGDPAAMAIIGSNHRLGTPGKSIYSVFFSSSRSGKPRFTCYDCGHVDARVSRALRHQRQDHFGHYPYPCEGSADHPAW
jgi:hypothetical protein